MRYAVDVGYGSFITFESDATDAGALIHDAGNAAESHGFSVPPEIDLVYRCCADDHRFLSDDVRRQIEAIEAQGFDVATYVMPPGGLGVEA